MRLTLQHFASLAVLAVSTTAYADTVYTNSATYAAATTTSTTITFNGIAPPAGFVAESNPFTLSGVTFSNGPSSGSFIIDSAFYGTPYPGGGYLNVTGFNPNSLTIALPPGVTAAAFEFGGLFGPTTSNFVVTLSDGFTTQVSSVNSITGTNSLDFLGFTSATPFTSIMITTPDTPNFNAFDNVMFGTANAPPVNPIPEPSSLLLLGTGLLTAFGVGRRRFSA